MDEPNTQAPTPRTPAAIGQQIAADWYNATPGYYTDDEQNELARFIADAIAAERAEADRRERATRVVAWREAVNQICQYCRDGRPWMTTLTPVHQGEMTGKPFYFACPAAPIHALIAEEAAHV